MYWIYSVTILLLGSLLFFVVLLASKNGRKSAQLEALKAELKKQAEEQARAQRIMDRVGVMSADDARRQLCKLQSK